MATGRFDLPPRSLLHVLLGASLLMAALVVSACEPSTSGEPADASPAMKELFAEDFLVGAALNPSQFTGQDTGEVGIVRRHFNTITPENTMKWESIHPEPGTYDFEAADRFVAFGEQNDMFIVGHTLVWHSQTPDWVFQDASGEPVSRDTLLRRMRDHIHTVVGRYKGRVDAWDVVNEAVADDGSLRESPWLTIIGEDYLAKAFQYAREADPDAELYYNDYSLVDPEKRAGAVRLIKKLRAQDVPVTGVGLQSHHSLDEPSIEQQRAAIEDFSGLGIDVMITELDVAVLPRPSEEGGADVTRTAEASDELDPYPDAFPDSMQQALARRYADLFEVYLDHRDVLSRVTFWGVTDADSWLNYWPIPGRTSYPLLFDRQNEPKPAFDAVVETAQEYDAAGN